MQDKPMSSPAIKSLIIFNTASAILKVRKFEDVVSKAVGYTKDKKVLNQQRKTLAKVDLEIDKITKNVDIIFSQLNIEDLGRIAKGHTQKLIQMIPEQTTNPEMLGLYLLFLEFQECADKRLDPIMKTLTTIDYMALIETISETIGLEEDISDDMYLLADEMIKKIKR